MKLRILAVALLTASLWAQTSAAPASQIIAGRVFVGGHTMQYVTDLTDKFGPRLTGSPNYNAAAQWAADQFRAMGIKDVRLEPLTIAHTWTRGTGSGRILTPEVRPLHIEALGWSPATPQRGVKGDVFVLDDVSAENIQKHQVDIRDHVIVLDLRKILRGAKEDSYKPWINLQAAPKLLAESGAKAVLLAGSRPSQVLNTTALGWDTSIAPLPSAFIGKEDGDYLMRISKTQPASVEFEYTSEVGGPAQVNNVVAEIRGSEKPEEWIILGAHLDSWDFATGAQDNGAGTAQVLEAARVLSSLGKAPRRSIRFALWAGEEEGLLGSRAYVKQHAAEIAKCVAVLNTDNGAGEVQGWKVEGREDLSKALQPFADEYLAPLGADEVSTEITYDTDHGPFMLAGVPALDMLVDMKQYMEIHHNAGDTLDKIKPVNMNIGAAVLALTANQLANADVPLGPHLNHEAVEKILKTKDLDLFLKSIGDW
jgi:carboxypeptidase Q